MSEQSGSREPAPAEVSSPRRRLSGIGFLLLGGWFAWTSLDLDTSVWLHVVLVAVGVVVLGYGAVQLARSRR